MNVNVKRKDGIKYHIEQIHRGNTFPIHECDFKIEKMSLKSIFN